MATPRTYLGRSLTAVAPVAAIPTTAAHLSLFNGENAKDGKTYTITAVGFTTATSAAATMILQLLALVGGGGQSGITGTAAWGPVATDGLASASRASVASAVSVVGGGGGGWHPVGNAVNSAALTATIGLGTWAYVRGLYYLPPGGVFSLAVLGSTAAGASQLSIQWEEA